MDVDYRMPHQRAVTVRERGAVVRPASHQESYTQINLSQLSSAETHPPRSSFPGVLAVVMREEPSP